MESIVQATQQYLFEPLAIKQPKEPNSTTFSDNMSLPIHRWYRFSAGFSAQWVRELLQKEKKHGKGARPSKSVAKPVPPSRDDRSASKPSVKPSVVRPAKVSEGEIVERRPREVSMSLSAL